MCLFIVAVHAFAYANAFTCASNQMPCIAMEWNQLEKKLSFFMPKKRMPNSQHDQGATRTPLDYHYHYYHYCHYNKLLFE